MTRPARARTSTVPMLSERDWQNLVLDVARVHGWTAYHTHRSQHSQAGWPDLVLLRPPEALFVELKRHDGRVTPAQLVFLDLLERCHFEVTVWRPQDEQTAFARLARKPPTREPTR